jgi:hypothetical protein
LDALLSASLNTVESRHHTTNSIDRILADQGSDVDEHRYLLDACPLAFPGKSPFGGGVIEDRHFGLAFWRLDALVGFGTIGTTGRERGRTSIAARYPGHYPWRRLTFRFPYQPVGLTTWLPADAQVKPQHDGEAEFPPCWSFNSMPMRLDRAIGPDNSLPPMELQAQAMTMESRNFRLLVFDILALSLTLATS